MPGPFRTLMASPKRVSLHLMILQQSGRLSEGPQGVHLCRPIRIAAQVWRGQGDEVRGPQAGDELRLWVVQLACEAGGRSILFLSSLNLPGEHMHMHAPKVKRVICKTWDRPIHGLNQISESSHSHLVTMHPQEKGSATEKEGLVPMA